ncbi:cysteine desulfurase-like protein [Streptomyces sp. 8L]|uniref:cysteine desulfurase-like protein n=1 Tax=Streptomyces sp. 8L TaxID=2877242 RepID=UPI001CD719AF|nr:cysteine desulfurase-like protein [Streptomyces sp. 8L]MCA1218979.1 cysteine desulfurase-like protein [Streptomyces sp. 8L]
MTYDIASIRARFPALDSGVAFFDGPGGTQTPRPVIDAVVGAMAAPLSNRGRLTAGELNADRIGGGARAALGDLLGAAPGDVVFGRSATQLTYDLARALAKTWAPGDEVVVTRLDHDANIRPWTQAAEAAGAVVRWADFDPESGELAAADIEAVLTGRTRLVAVTAASNLIGTRPPVAEIAELVHAAGALLHVDGVHHTAHAAVDLGLLGADTYVCSVYKLLGPHLGVLAGAPGLLEELRPDKLLPSSDAVPERFELGTLPYELLAGATAAVDFLAGLGDGGAGTGTRRQRLLQSFAALEGHENVLRGRIESGLARLPGLTVHSRAADRTPTLLMTFEGRDAADAYRFLAERDIAAPAASFYALEASRRLGLADAGGLRIGLAPYNDTSDVDRLLDGLVGFLGV